MLDRISYSNHFIDSKKAILCYISTLYFTLAQQIINDHLPSASVFTAHGDRNRQYTNDGLSSWGEPERAPHWREYVMVSYVACTDSENDKIQLTSHSSSVMVSYVAFTDSRLGSKYIAQYLNTNTNTINFPNTNTIANTLVRTVFKYKYFPQYLNTI